MRRGIAVLGLLLVAATVNAISQGPGGRIYMTERVQEESGDKYVSLKSYRIDADWNIVGAPSGDGSIAPVDHGLILDNSDGYDDYKDNWGISPEIETGAGEGFGARIVMGANYNQSPLSLYPDYECMDLIRITTTNGGKTIELLGTGRVGHAEWYSSTHNFGHTDRGNVGMPNAEGGFPEPWRVLVFGQDFRSYLSVVTDTNSDNDCTDSDEDYLTFTTITVNYPEDFEFVGDKLWVSNNWNSTNGSGIFYYQRQENGTIANPVRFLEGDPTRTAEFGQNGLSFYGKSMVADVIDGHDAVWVVNQAQNWIDRVQEGYCDLLLAIDLNDDGDANDTGEVSIIYTNDSATGLNGDNDPGVGWSDMELVTNYMGTRFLLVQNTAETENVGQRLLVLELLDNGDYAGTDESCHIICATDLDGLGGDWEVLTEIEFDANVSDGPYPIPGDANDDHKVDGGDLQQWQINYDPLGLNANTWEMGDWNDDGNIDGGDLQLWQINYEPLGFPAGAVPEPTTMLLLGTGVLGALGCARRRKLS